jgi:MFS family permease
MATTRVEHHLKAEGGGRLVGGRRVVLVAAAALALVALIGLGSAQSHWSHLRVGGPPHLKLSNHLHHTDSGRPASPHPYIGYLLVAFGLLGLSPLVAAYLRGRARARPQIRLARARRAVAFSLAVVASVLVALLVMRLVFGPQGPPAVTASPLVWGLAALALAAVAAIPLWLRVREPARPARGDVEDGSSELLAAVDLSLTDLDQERDPRRAVIRAYARMEGALGLHGLARRPSETPLEYLARALASLRVGRASVERLTALFERAKFSAHEIDGSMKADALAALRALRDELAEPAA